MANNDSHGEDDAQIEYPLGYRRGQKTAMGLKKQPSYRTPHEILETFVKDHSEKWRDNFIAGFWDGVRLTEWEDVRHHER